MNDYKQEIRDTRKGCLGSSDAALLTQIASLGYVPKSAYKRLAIVKGLLEQQEIPETAAIRAGNEIEMAIFGFLKKSDDGYVSNPMLESKRFSKPNVKLISHPDIMKVDKENKVLYLYEVKATKNNVEKTRQLYHSQLFTHFMLGKEYADEELGKDYKVKVILVHYSTEGLNLENGEHCDFDVSRLTLKEVKYNVWAYDIGKAMFLVNEFLEDFTFYSEDEVIAVEYLPEKIQTQFVDISQKLREIKQREVEVEAFRKKLYDFLKDKGVKKVECEDFSFVVVEPSEQVTFDTKSYLQDMEEKYPRKTRKIKEKYKKVTQRSGYVKITVK